MEILGKRKEFSMNKKIIIALILIIIASVVTTFAIIIYNLKTVSCRLLSPLLPVRFH